MVWSVLFIWVTWLERCPPSSQDFIDITLSKTQRKTPTVIHKHYQIHRIRHFYMRKVKFTQQNYHDRLTQILTDFPKLDVSQFPPLNVTTVTCSMCDTENVLPSSRTSTPSTPTWWTCSTTKTTTSWLWGRSTSPRTWSISTSVSHPLLSVTHHCWFGLWKYPLAS